MIIRAIEGVASDCRIEGDGGLKATCVDVTTPAFF